MHFPLVPLRALYVCAVLAVSLPGLSAQHLEPVPQFGEVGGEVAVTLRARSGEAIAGVLVEALAPQGKVVRLGVTDDGGTVRFVPSEEGQWEFHAIPPDGEVLLITPYFVEGERRRWLWALLCVPAGLALLGLNLRRWRAAAADSDA